jgi:hypothetical protein
MSINNFLDNGIKPVWSGTAVTLKEGNIANYSFNPLGRINPFNRFHLILSVDSFLNFGQL